MKIYLEKIYFIVSHNCLNFDFRVRKCYFQTGKQKSDFKYQIQKKKCILLQRRQIIILTRLPFSQMVHFILVKSQPIITIIIKALQR